MGFFDRLFSRRSPHPDLVPLLKATVWDDGDDQFWVRFEQLHADCQSVEYIQLIAHYYAKIIFNFGTGHDEVGQSARVCVHLMRNLLRQEINSSSNVMQLADLADTASVIPYDVGRRGTWEAEAVLYFVSSAQRHITTDFPRNSTTQQTVFSLFVLIQECVKSLADPSELRVLGATLQNMQNAYESGVDWGTQENLSLVPTQAYAGAVMELQ